MGNSNSKPSEKYNKNHITKKGFQFGLSFGKSDLTMEGNIQIGWTNKTIKNYTCVPKINDNEISQMVSTQKREEEGQETFNSS